MNSSIPGVKKKYNKQSHFTSLRQQVQLTRMADTIEQHLANISVLCKKYEVQLLELFGSAARGDFDTATSDFDFLVAFLPDGTVNAADRYLGLLVDLDTLLERKIDLVDVRSHRNPFFMVEALKHRVKLYAA